MTVRCSVCRQGFAPMESAVHHYQTKHEMTYRGAVQKYDGSIREMEARLNCLKARANAAQKDSAA